MSIFHGGIIFPPAKGSLQAKSVDAPRVCLRVDSPSVAVGDSVALGQSVGTIAGRVQLSTIAGTVTDAANGLVQITACSPEDGSKIPVLESIPFGKRTNKTLLEATPEELLAEIFNAGLVEADGTNLADHLMHLLELSKAGKLRMAAVSLMEPDPASLTLSSLAVEFAPAIAGGLAILLRLLSLREGSILCDKARPEVIDAIAAACEESRLIAVETLENRYPTYHPKLLTRYFCQRELSTRSKPEAAGLFLIDAECCVAVYQLFATGVPRLQVRTTIWEEGVGEVYDFPIGMALSDLWALELWKSVSAPEKEDEERKVLVKPSKTSPICGGLMSGAILPEFIDRTVTVLTPAPDGAGEADCIRCGRCAEACPMYLHPYRFQPRHSRWSLLGGDVRDTANCIGCGVCSYVCPSEIPLRRYVLRARQEADLLRKV